MMSSSVLAGKPLKRKKHYDFLKKLSIHHPDSIKKSFKLIAETTVNEDHRHQNREKLKKEDDPLKNLYPPRVPAFTRDQVASILYTNEEWLNMDIESQARYIHGIYEELLARRNIDYSPRILTCKVFRESVYTHNGKKIFQIQKRTSIKNSTASGISQVTLGTTKDVFDRQIPPRIAPSVVPGFEDIKDGDEFHKKMANNMIAQMELGLMVLRAKQVDTGAKRIKTLLKHYYGSSKRANRCYADRVYNCAHCMLTKGVVETCLDKALARGNC